MYWNLVIDKKRRQGKQGHLDSASKAILSAEFGTENEEEVIKKILTNGTAQTVEVSLLPTPPSPEPRY